MRLFNNERQQMSEFIDKCGLNCVQRQKSADIIILDKVVQIYKVSLYLK